MSLSNWKDAILLVAGKGERLGHLTHDLPKPLIRINSVAILENAVMRLAEHGIRQLHLVTGYHREKLMSHAYRYANGMTIHEIHNDAYERTNNMYSLWLAQEILAGGCLLLEGDVFFDGEVLRRLVDAPLGISYWFADEFATRHDGCALATDAMGRVNQLEIFRGHRATNDGNWFKSLGILAINADLGRKLSGWLDAEVKKGNVRLYYDLILRKHLEHANIQLLNVRGCRWAEVDDSNDLKYAEKLFAGEKQA